MAASVSEAIAEMIQRTAASVPPPAKEFAAALYDHVSRSDLEALGETGRANTAAHIWDFMQARPGAAQGRPKIRIQRPAIEGATALAPILVDLVNDDMPFLVDSVTSFFNRRGLAVELVLHPMVRVTRDGDGQLIGYGAGPSESVMHLKLATGMSAFSAEAADFAALETELAEVLAEVRAAVADWPEMRARAASVAEELGRDVASWDHLPPEEVREAKEFLDWLCGNNFTFLGYRELAYRTTAEGPVVEPVSDAGLGILRDPEVALFRGQRTLAEMPPDMRAFLEQPVPLLVVKANRKSNVHRATHLDVIGVKRLDASGKVIGERRFAGLFTSQAYNTMPRQIPLLRRKIQHVIERSGLKPGSHDGKALIQILDTFPRDELFQISEDELVETSLGILGLQDRHRIALFVRRDPFGRFASCLVFVPGERYTPALRERIHALVSEAFEGSISASYLQISESPLARLHLIVRTTPSAVAAVDLAALEARLVDVGRTWAERLHAAFAAVAATRPGERLTDGDVELIRRYGHAFPTAYTENNDPADAVTDITRLEAATPELPALSLGPRAEGAGNQLTLKVYHPGRPVALSDLLPMLENRGLRVLTEDPYEIRIPNTADPEAEPAISWIQKLDVETVDGSAVDVAAVHPAFEAGMAASWRGAIEEDGFNRLMVSARLEWREVVVLRAFAKYLKQTGFSLSQYYIEGTLARHADITTRLIALFHARFALSKPAGADEETLVTEIESALDQVTVLDEDRILRRYLNLICSCLRTNFYQPDAEGQPKAYVSFKFDSHKLDELPAPRPLFEIWVYSPDMESIHLRGGKVARGGIRFSDRREDFRFEILGLMKAQNVKNAVIVPVGSKGGFVIKRPPAPSAGRAAYQAYVVSCYQTMMRGMLDITDNRKGTEIVPPVDVVRHDPDDPYLVVAADKGTATFSDIANGVSQEYGFWLDDAFASGGSAGYDHKAMGITARGAWVAVERHLREAGIDLRTRTITVVGVGDMSGDVFGNGMLHSDQLKLVAAFNHLHIFLDPDPSTRPAFEERKRLFTTPGTSWADYRTELISKGGGVFERSAKSIPISPEVKAAFEIAEDHLPPTELIRRLLKAKVDLLFFGGIGTYIKASTESNLDAGDRANDALRIDGRDINASIIGEGANLGATQRGRIEYALQGAGGFGGRMNTDAIDNSAGVDTSDHEVNLKVLLTDAIAAGAIDLTQRNAILADMVDDVAAHVLSDNYLQTGAMSMAQRQGANFTDNGRRLMTALEQEAGLDRAIEFLPTNQALNTRGTAGFTRPELAVLIAYAKIALYNKMLPSPISADEYLGRDLELYFPPLVRDRFAASIKRHGLRREIVSTVLTNQIINRGGISFVADLERMTGAKPATIAGAFVVAREMLGFDSVWAAIEALDGSVPPDAQLDLHLDLARALSLAVAWLVDKGPAANLAAEAEGAPTIDTVLKELKGPVTAMLERLTELDPVIGATVPAPGIPADLAQRVALILSVARNLDVIGIAGMVGGDIERAVAAFFAASNRFGIDTIRHLAASLATPDSWAIQAKQSLLQDLADHQESIAVSMLNHPDGPGAWIDGHTASIERLDRVMAEISSGPADFARLTVAERAIRSLFLEI